MAVPAAQHIVKSPVLFADDVEWHEQFRSDAITDVQSQSFGFYVNYVPRDIQPFSAITS
jgi:hypothetical protein